MVCGLQKLLLLLRVDHALSISFSLALTPLDPTALQIVLLAVFASLAFLL